MGLASLFYIINFKRKPKSVPAVFKWYTWNRSFLNLFPCVYLIRQVCRRWFTAMVQSCVSIFSVSVISNSNGKVFICCDEKALQTPSSSLNFFLTNDPKNFQFVWSYQIFELRYSDTSTVFQFELLGFQFCYRKYSKLWFGFTSFNLVTCIEGNFDELMPGPIFKIPYTEYLQTMKALWKLYIAKAYFWYYVIL